MAQSTVKSRIQLKNDIEANWNKAVNFIPLKGEIIIYSIDESHPFSRLKVGDGITTVINLPFINSLSGDDIAISKLNHKLTFGANQEYVFDGSEDVTVPVYTGVTI